MENTAVDFNDLESLETELKAVDFNDLESLETELTAVGVEAPKAKKEKAPRKPRIIIITVPAGLIEGDTFEFEVPVADRRSGVVAGIPVEEMTEEQLKIEYRNANSVFYKQTKAKGVASDVATERLNKVKAVMADKGIAPTSKAAAPVDAEAIANLIKSGKISVDDIQALLNI